MNMSPKNVFKTVFLKLRWVGKIALRPFFSSSFMSGRYFDHHLAGYIWGIKAVWQRNILRLAKPLPFPANHAVWVSNPDNLVFHPDDLHNFQSFGIYFQNFSGKIVIGRGTYIAPNVGIITANHNPNKLNEHLSGENVELAENCWIGMNAVILPGVTLGPNTIVGAGSVVTKSFLTGNCIIAGNPARHIRDL